MRSVLCSALNRHVSALGFGCASLGSRIAPRAGLKALELAFDRGVTWYDVAPSYGDGHAEALLGWFLKERRDKVVVCTKVGIPRPEISFVKKLLRPASRWAVKAFPDLRNRIAKARVHVPRVPLDPCIIRSSVETSLRLLQTDYVDVLALHEPTLEDCTNPAVIEALERLIRDGYVNTISIAGSIDALVTGASFSNVFKVSQFADGPYLKSAQKLRLEHPETDRLFFVTHSVFGQQIPRSLQHISKKRGLAESVSDLLLDYALAENTSGVVLASMYSRSHIEHNCARASQKVNESIRMQIDLLTASA